VALDAAIAAYLFLSLPRSPQASTFQKMAPSAIVKIVGRQIIDSR
jgi:hypothetical protein